MTTATLLALLTFSFVSSATPGPNNIMLFSSGLNFGLRRTMPHALGISFGFGVLLTAVGVGLGVLLQQIPLALLAIKVLGSAYMLYLAWRIIRSTSVDIKDANARPMTFVEAALFQWVNPKAWAMATVAMSAYTGNGDYATNVVIVVFCFCVVNFPSVTAWAGLGLVLRKFLQDPKKLRIFNVVMAIALVFSLWPMLLA